MRHHSERIVLPSKVEKSIFRFDAEKYKFCFLKNYLL